MPAPPTPKGWPPTLPYLTSPAHHALSAAQLAALRLPSTPHLPSALTPTPSPLVRIQPIRSAAHPAHGQHGLFAARDLPPGSFIAAYLGTVHGAEALDTSDSDYDLWLDKAAGVSVDAARGGNEARFVNDYRGVADRPNACFGNAFCQRWGQTCVAVWVAPGNKGIRKGDEILVSYGKGFWEQRCTDKNTDIQ